MDKSDIEPLLFLDVDGVLLPEAGETDTVPSALLPLMRPLQRWFEIVWVSLREAEANWLIGPQLEWLDCEFLSYGRSLADQPLWRLKAQAVADRLRREPVERPIIIVDDDLHENQALTIAPNHLNVTVVTPDRNVGLSEQEVARLYTVLGK